MPCSTLFRGYMRTAMSLRPTTSLSLLNANNKKKPASSSSLFLGFVLRRNTHLSARSIGLWSFSRQAGGRRGVTCPVSFSSGAAVEVDWRQRRKSSTAPLRHQQSPNFRRFAYQDALSSDESDREFGFGSSRQQVGGSTLENIEEWRWKITMLLRNENEQEIVSREKKDRRDFDQLSALASRMGLHR